MNKNETIKNEMNKAGQMNDAKVKVESEKINMAMAEPTKAEAAKAETVKADTSKKN